MTVLTLFIIFLKCFLSADLGIFEPTIATIQVSVHTRSIILDLGFYRHHPLNQTEIFLYGLLFINTIPRIFIELVCWSNPKFLDTQVHNL
jgi:hypothetical protein